MGWQRHMLAAAELDVADAMTHLGPEFEIRAARAGHVGAMMQCFERAGRGDGVPRNAVVCARWLQEAVDHFHPLALYDSGVWANLKGDRETARTFFRLAAEEGHVPSMKCLAELGAMPNALRRHASEGAFWKERAEDLDGAA